MNYESYYEREHLKVTFWSVLLPIDPDQSGVALTARTYQGQVQGVESTNPKHEISPTGQQKRDKIILKTKKYIFFIPTSSNAFRHI